jgi:hypothetical protein
MSILLSSSAKDRFIKCLPQTPYCSKNPKQDGVIIREKHKALAFPYIQLNQRMKSYLPFDVDREGAAFSWEGAELPPPTIISINSDNGRAHLLYELNAPVCFPDHNGNGNPRKKPMEYFNAIYRSMCAKLDADCCYHGFITKNPLNNRWTVLYHDLARYDLGELAEYAKPIFKNHSDFTESSVDIDENTIIYEGTRFNVLYDVVRFYAYKSVRRVFTYEELYALLLEYASGINTRQCKPPMGNRSIHSLVKYISGYVWNNRENIISNQKNRGACGLSPILHRMTNQEYIEEIKKRQQIGAAYTNKIQRNTTEAKIIQSIEKLSVCGEKITIGAVSRDIGISKSNISVRYGHLFK